MKALIVIDVQNDYFSGGRFPLEGADEALQRTLTLIGNARRNGALVIAVQHLAAADAPFFATGTIGAELHPALQSVLDGDAVVTKQEADSFLGTNLGELLKQNDVDAIHLAGMMTQHCVTHTALSPDASGFDITIHAEGCAAPTRALSALAISGLKARFSVV